LKEFDNPLTDVVCEIHDIAEMLKAQRLEKVYPVKENEIEDTLETNSDLNETDPPVPDDENDIPGEYEIMEDEPCPEDDDETKEDDAGEDKGLPPAKKPLQEETEDLPPRKKAWYEKVADVIKGLTYPVSGALEYLKLTGKIPIPVNFLNLGAKVRNVIDNIVTKIKVFTGRITPEQAVEERKNNEAALVGQTIAQKQKQPIKETLKQVFGKVGSVIKHTVQQVVTRIVPAPVRVAIKVGTQKILPVIASGIKAFAQKAVEGVKSFFGGIKRMIFG